MEMKSGLVQDYYFGLTFGVLGKPHVKLENFPTITLPKHLIGDRQFLLIQFYTKYFPIFDCLETAKLVAPWTV